MAWLDWRSRLLVTHVKYRLCLLMSPCLPPKVPQAQNSLLLLLPLPYHPYPTLNTIQPHALTTLMELCLIALLNQVLWGLTVMGRIEWVTRASRLQVTKHPSSSRGQHLARTVKGIPARKPIMQMWTKAGSRYGTVWNVSVLGFILNDGPWCKLIM